jgi:hypothetical protein
MELSAFVNDSPPSFYHRTHEIMWLCLDRSNNRHGSKRNAKTSKIVPLDSQTLRILTFLGAQPNNKAKTNSAQHSVFNNIANTSSWG